jgi:DNA-binding Lrp family transcriptional regulator
MLQNRAEFEDDSEQIPVEHTDKNRNRAELLEAINSLGLGSSFLNKHTIEQLEQLVKGAEWLNTYRNDRENSIVNDNSGNPISLTDVDKRMLQILLTSSGRISSLSLSRRLEIPLTTIQRRRKRLENEFLEASYSLKLDRLGFRKVDLLISTSNGRASAIGKELLSHDAITTVCRSIGEHTIDLHAEMVFKDNAELSNVIEWVKSLEGVNDVVWTEPVSIVGKKSMAVFEKVLSELG